jgi:hypothetical protein
LRDATGLRPELRIVKGIFRKILQGIRDEDKLWQEPRPGGAAPAPCVPVEIASPDPNHDDVTNQR